MRNCAIFFLCLAYACVGQAPTPGRQQYETSCARCHGGDATGGESGPSILAQIDKSNVARLAPKWMFPLPGVTSIENTPLVVEGIMYVSSANEVYGLDAGTGRQVWHYQRPRTRGLVGNAASGFNRGVAVRED